MSDCALLSHFLTAYYIVTVGDSCFITRFHVISSILANYINFIGSVFDLETYLRKIAGAP